MFLLHYAGRLVAAVALLMLAALWPAWIGSGWGMWRWVHFRLFALGLLLLDLHLREHCRKAADPLHRGTVSP